MCWQSSLRKASAFWAIIWNLIGVVKLPRTHLPSPSQKSLRFGQYINSAEICGSYKHNRNIHISTTIWQLNDFLTKFAEVLPEAPCDDQVYILSPNTIVQIRSPQLLWYYSSYKYQCKQHMNMFQARVPKVYHSASGSWGVFYLTSQVSIPSLRQTFAFAAYWKTQLWNKQQLYHRDHLQNPHLVGRS